MEMISNDDLLKNVLIKWNYLRQNDPDLFANFDAMSSCCIPIPYEEFEVSETVYERIEPGVFHF